MVGFNLFGCLILQFLSYALWCCRPRAWRGRGIQRDPEGSRGIQRDPEGERREIQTEENLVQETQMGIYFGGKSNLVSPTENNVQTNEFLGKN